MDKLNELLRANFGVVSYAQLLESCASQTQIRHLLKNQALTRIRHGWYASAGANQAVLRAVKSGGVLSGPAALQLHKVWTPPEQPIHVRTHRRNRLRLIQINGEPDLVGVELSNIRNLRVNKSVDPVETALLVSMLMCPRDTAIVLADSALNNELLSLRALRHVAEHAGAKGASVLGMVSEHSESGTETIFRLWLMRNRIKFVQQVRIAGVGRVDFLIGQSLVVEIDSFAHHAGWDEQRKDRFRDRRLAALGYMPVRLTYSDVMYSMDKAGQDILTIIRRDAHRRFTVRDRQAARARRDRARREG
ncbi:MAG: DUF559 domain-containing protein [Gulosibacter sp.]|uniref:DUF559 domain-containing protein n=1 Tax=Gulosibacter sp. TaxID=2817531 RepID=UPI003F8E43B8